MKLDLRGFEHLVAAGPFAFGDVPSFAGISGGRTSAMLAALLDPRVTLCFENTGRESEATLQFLLRLEDALQRKIFWLEWRPPLKKGAPPKEFRFAIVDYKTCVKHKPGDPRAGGVLFDGLLQALAEHRATKGKDPIVPHSVMRICTGYLKHKVMTAFMKSLGVDDDDDHEKFVGLRADEPSRIANLKGKDTLSRTYRTPLGDAGLGKYHINGFWARQPFDLEIAHDREGNCGACFLKDHADQSRVLGESWVDAQWWIDLQRRYPGFGGNSHPGYAQLLKERPVRLAVAEHLAAGRDVVLASDEVSIKMRVVLRLRGRGRGGVAAFPS